MNRAILNTDVQDYINKNLDSDPAALILKGISYEGVSTFEIVEQVESKKRCQKKLPTWFQHPGIYYPNKLNIEQTSSEVTAAYKAGLTAGQSLLDLTGGFGVDSYYFAKTFKTVVHCELNLRLSQIVQHNFKVLQCNQVKTLATDGLLHLQNTPDAYDWIYIDPSRRHESKGKVFFLKDCLPNIPQHLETLWRRSKNIMIKTSPLLDISVGITELQFIKEVHVVAVNNEVKELLWILQDGFSGPITMMAINLKSSSQERFHFVRSHESQADPSYSLPLAYLYEPNAAILKSGGFGLLATQFNINKLHKHSHLYTHSTLIDFPGRKFKILKTIPYKKNTIKALGLKKANITTRNFPLTTETIKQTFKIKDGGSCYLFFTTNIKNEKIVLLCEKPVKNPQ